MNFVESLKIAPDKEKEKLLKLQAEIEKRSMYKQEVLTLIENLSDDEKERLKQLYIEQIEDFNISTEQYKKKILKIKSILNKQKKIN